MTEAIILDSVSKSYGEIVAVKDVTLQVEKGETLGILGPSGAGKSTLLRLMDLLEPPDKGSVHVNGVKADARTEKTSALRRQVGMVLQKPVVLNRSVWNNLAYPLRIRELDEAEISEKVDSELKNLGLYERRMKNARGLSGGEMQRLCFSRATVCSPDILLLDEFAANLDPANVNLLENQVKTFKAGNNERTVVVVTHNLFQAKRMCDRIALVWDGELVEVAGRDKFFDHPGDERTSKFLSGELVY